MGVTINNHDVGGQQLRNYDRPFKFAIDIAAAQYLWNIEPLDFPLLSSEATQELTAIAKQKFGTIKGGKVLGLDATGLEGGGNLESNQDIDTMEGGEITGIKLGTL